EFAHASAVGDVGEMLTRKAMASPAAVAMRAPPPPPPKPPPLIVAEGPRTGKLIETPSCESATPLSALPRDFKFTPKRAVDGPTYQETIDWLARTLAELDVPSKVDGVETHRFSGIVSFGPSESCTLELRSGMRDKAVKCQTTRVNFEHVDPASVTLS